MTNTDYDNLQENPDVSVSADVPEQRGHYVYVLRCSDGTLYTGYTTDVPRRVAEHAAGDGAKYTRGRTPLELVHVEPHGSRSTATQREHEIKQLDRPAKESLVSEYTG